MPMTLKRITEYYEQHPEAEAEARRKFRQTLNELLDLTDNMVKEYRAVHGVDPEIIFVPKGTPLLSPPATTVPAIIVVFSTGGAEIVSSLPVQAFLAASSDAQSGARGWREERQLLTFSYQKEAGMTYIQIRPSESDSPLDAATIQSLWQHVKSVSDLDGDVFLIMLAQLMAGPRDQRSYTVITSQQMLEYRGIRPIMKPTSYGERRAGHRQEDLATIAACVSRLSHTWFIVDQAILDEGTTGKRKKRVKFTRESRPFNFGDVIRQHEFDWNSDTPLSPSMAIAWQYQEADWMLPFFKGPNRQVAWLIQQTLNYDPFHEMWEKRLARYFMFHLRINAKNAPSITRKIGSLIEELCLPVDERNPERTRERFERAMQRLQDHEQISDWHYVEDISKRPARKWLATWQSYSIVITAAPVTANKYQRITHNAQIRRTRADMMTHSGKARKGQKRS